MTVRCNTVDELFNDITFRIAHGNFKKLLPPEYADEVCPPLPGATRGFAVIAGDKKWDISLIEIYPHDIFEKIETCFYIPLKDE